MTREGMMLVTIFALLAGVCLWLYWRERGRSRALADGLRVLRERGLITTRNAHGGVEIFDGNGASMYEPPPAPKPTTDGER